MQPQENKQNIHTAPGEGSYFMDVVPSPSILDQNSELNQLTNPAVKDKTLRRFGRNNIALMGIALALLLPLTAWGYRHFSRPILQVSPAPTDSKLSISKGDFYSVGIHGDLQVSRDTTLQGATTIQQDLTVQGSQTIFGNLVVTGTVTAANINGTTGGNGVVGHNGAQGPRGAQGLQGPSGKATCPNGNCVSLQSSSPSTQEAGTIDISGDINAGGQVQAATANIIGNSVLHGSVTTGNLIPVTAGSMITGIIRNTVTTTGSSLYQDTTRGLAIGQDGFGRMVYQDSGSIKFVQCTNASCSTSNITTINTAPETNDDEPSLRIGPDGLARIIFVSYDSNDVVFERCTNADCSTRVTTVVASPGNLWDTAINLDSGGLARLAYHDYTSNSVYYLHCLDQDCATKTTTIVDNAGGHHWDIDMTLGADGFERFTYPEASDGTAKQVFIRCLDIDCTTKTRTLIGVDGAKHYYGRVEIGSDSLPRIVFSDTVSGVNAVKFVRCLNADCSSVNTQTFTSNGPDAQVSLVLINDKAQILSDNGGSSLQLIRCSDLDCASNTVNAVGPTSSSVYPSMMVLGQDGLLRMRYYDPSTNSIIYAQFMTVDGQNVQIAGNTIGDVSNYYGQAYVQGANIQGYSGSTLLTVNQQGSGLVLISKRMVQVWLQSTQKV